MALVRTYVACLVGRRGGVGRSTGVDWMDMVGRQAIATSLWVEFVLWLAKHSDNA